MLQFPPQWLGHPKIITLEEAGAAVSKLDLKMPYKQNR